MTDSLSVYAPINTLKKVSDNIWIADGDVINMAMGLGLKAPFTTRMTVVRLKNRGLWCHSPIAPCSKLLEAINQLGEVQHLVSPNKIHYAYISDWKAIYPHATTCASPNVRERAKSQKITVKFDEDLTGTAPIVWEDDIDQLIFKGSRVMDEVVFFHRNSKTLLLTDLIENFEPQKVHSYPLKIMMKLAGIIHPGGRAPIDFRATFWGHKNLAKQSVEQILAWQPDKVIFAHGRWYKENAVEELKQAFRWVY